MLASYIKRYGRNEKLVTGELSIPAIGPNDVLIEIHAASVNPIDFKIRDGQLRILRKYSFPLILGHDLAGVVVKIGSNVKAFNVGDEVFSRPRNGRIGSFAEYIAVDQNEIALKPTSASFAEAASIPLVGLTSWQALVDIAHVAKGQNVFIPAGSGGIGTFAIQLAKHLGAVVATTTSARNAELVKRLGADRVIDYRSQQFENVLRDQDVVFDTLGGESLYKSFGIVKRGGYIVSIAGAPDEITAREMGLGFFKTKLLKWVGRKAAVLADAHGVKYRFLFMRPDGRVLSRIAALVDAGAIKPVIDKEYPLRQAQEAIDYSSSGRATGKIIIKVR